MKVSRNELTATLKKAFEGLGFSVGDYQDAAAMIIWSQMHGFDGLQQLQDALPFLNDCLCLHAKLIHNYDNQALLDGQGSSVLLSGSQTVRLACALARQYGSSRVRLDNCHNHRLIIQRLASAAASHSALVAYWVEGTTAIKVSIGPGAKRPDYGRYVVQDAVADQSLLIFAGADLASIEQQFDDEVALGFQTEAYSWDAMVDRYDIMLDEGIEIDESLWYELDTLVARVLVESTDSSRAGAGD